MSDKENKSPITVKEEEIDLGSMFKLIGKAITNFFNFIGVVLMGVFHYFIIFLLFIKENLKPVLIAIFIGAVLGKGLDYITPPRYTYDMIIEPNYGSIDQVFEKMEYYNVLVDSKDSVTLSKKFNISYKSANSITGFELNPYETKKDQILAYDAFIKRTDTLTQQYFTFNDFTGKGTSQFDSKRYVYRIYSRIPNLELFTGIILAEIEENPTIKKRKRIQLSTLKLDSIAVRINLREIDSLRSLYKRVTLLELEREATPNGSSTYLDFSKEAQSNNNDIKLFNISKELNSKLIEIERQKETSEEIVNVITTFNPAGAKRANFSSSKMFLLSWLFSGGVILFILLKKLNAYLIKYKEQIIH